MPITISELSELVRGTLHGDGDAVIDSVASPDRATASDVAFIADAAMFPAALSTNAGCLVIPIDSELELPCPSVSVADPKTAFALIGALLHPREAKPAGIHPSAVVSDSAEVGANVYIGPFCSVGDESRIGSGTQLREGARVGNRVTIGDECTIHPNVVVEDDCQIGSRVILKAGAVIGAKGFGFVRDGNALIKFPQVGKVVIEDEVEIGANSCVDRGALGETRIGEGTKIDNLVQIAHNVSIGKRVVIASLTGVSGSAVIGDDCVVGGQVGFADHTEVESGAVIGAKSAVFPGKKVRKGVWAGIPVLPLDEYKRLHAHVRSLPRLKGDIRRMKELLERLEGLFRKTGG